ncbi:MAG: hypothetical protein JNJ88_12255 [Planctomycetes bacterium]|nr:hypothetical protein [Planctomycetota bacterium]
MSDAFGRNGCAQFAEWHDRYAIGVATEVEPRSMEIELYEAHLRICALCRAKASEAGEWVSALRAADRRLGTPSRRFRERLAARLEGEAVSLRNPEAKSPAPDGPRTNAPTTKPQKPLETSMRPHRSLPARQGARRVKRWSWGPVGIVVGLVVGSFFARGVFLPQPGVAVERSAPDVRTDRIAAPAVSRVSPPETEPPSPILLASQLTRLRTEAIQPGFLQKDPVATAWWLVAEARAATIDGIPAPDPELIREAQLAISRASYASSYGRDIAVLGIVESSQALGVGDLSQDVRRVLACSATDRVEMRAAGYGDSRGRARGQVDARDRVPVPAQAPPAIAALSEPSRTSHFVRDALRCLTSEPHPTSESQTHELLALCARTWPAQTPDAASGDPRGEALRALAMASLLR